MSKQTKKGNNGTSSQNGKKAFTVTTDVQEIFGGVNTQVLQPAEETTEIELTQVETVETSVATTDNSEVRELPSVETIDLQPKMITVEVSETLTGTSISEEATETPVMVENSELQPEAVVEMIVTPEAIDAPIGEVIIELQPETVTEEPLVAEDALTVVTEATDNITNETESNVITTDETIKDADSSNTNGESDTKSPVTGKTPPIKKQAPKPPVAKEKKQSPKKATDDAKEEIAKEKKVTLAGSGYHYYRNWLRDFLRSHGVPSARFTKSPENYNGNITVLESEKEKGVLALEQWVTENPNIKEMFWAVNK